MAYRDNRADRSIVDVEPNGAATDPPDTEEHAKLIELVRECYEEESGDWKATAKLTRERMEPEMVEQCLSAAIWYTVRVVASEHRRRAVPDEDEAAALEAAVNRGVANVRSLRSFCLYQFPLPGGALLGDAKRGDVEEAAERYLKLAATNAARGKWLTAVAALVKGEKSVRECVTEKRLADLREKFGA